MQPHRQFPRRAAPLKPLAITIGLSTFVFLAIPHILIAPVWHSWPRASLALVVGLSPVVWAARVCFMKAGKPGRVVIGLAVLLGLFWLAMSGNLAWLMFKAIQERF